MRTTTLLCLAALVCCGLLGCAREPGRDRLLATPTRPQQTKPVATDQATQQPTPRPGAAPLRIVFSGLMQGHLEPCGCASAQAGGIDRRQWWFRQNKQRFDIKLEGGNLIAGNNPLERLKLMTIQDVLGGVMGYEVFPLGPNDLSLGAEELASYHGPDGAPFLVTDLRKIEGSTARAPYLTHKILPAGGYKVLVLSLAGPDGMPAKTGYEILPPERAVRAAIRAAGARGVAWDCSVLFVNYGGAKSARLEAKQLAGIDIVAAFPEAVETISKPEIVARDPKTAGVARTVILFPGWRGKNLLLWEGKPDAQGSWITTRTHKEILSVTPSTVPGKRPPGVDPDVWGMLRQHRQQVGELGVLEEMANVKATVNGAQYVGANACGRCHHDAFQRWQASPHPFAWKDLAAREKRDHWPATKHPDCVGCHTVGYGEKSGFVNAQKTPKLTSVGCEACHGPGSAHVAAMQPIQTQLDAKQEPPRAEIDAAIAKSKPLKPTGKTCFRCHNFEQSPGFRFNEKWQVIQHGLDKR